MRPVRRARASPARPGRATGGGRGFTLIELVAVIVIMGVMAAAAAVSMSGTASSRQNAAGRQMARDFNYARERALATGTRTWVTVGASTNSYTLLAENAASPGRAGAVGLADPATGGAFVVTLNTGPSAGVSIVMVTIPGGGSDLGFDWLGRPQDTTGTLIAQNATVMLTGQRIVTVAAGTGLASTP